LSAGRRVILTRPTQDSQAWTLGLQAAGHAVVNWPLIEIAPLPPLEPLQNALAHWSRYQAVMFVSRNAVAYTFATGKPATGWGTTRCWATGPGTRQALLDAGVPDQLIDAPAADATQFDTEALWQVVKKSISLSQPVLILRGSQADQQDFAAQGVGRDWLMQQLAQAGVAVQTWAVYQRVCPVWSEQQRAMASQALSDGSVWVFSSSQAILHLQQLLSGQDWSGAKAVATHERIGQAAALAGMGKVYVCKPTVQALQSSLESLA